MVNDDKGASLIKEATWYGTMEGMFMFLALFKSIIAIIHAIPTIICCPAKV